MSTSGATHFDLRGPGPRPPALPLGLESKFLPVKPDIEILPPARPRALTEQNSHEVHVALAAIIAVVLYGLIYFAIRPIVFPRGSPAFSDLYRAGRMVNAGQGAQVYDPVAQRRFDARLQTLSGRPEHRLASTPLNVAPTILAIFAPLSLLSYRHADLLWYVVNVGMLACIPFVLRRRVGRSDKLMVSDLLAPTVFLPALLALVEGEPSILMLLLFTMAFVELRENRDFRAGGLLALAAFKPELVLPLVLALLLAKRWKAVSGFAVAGLAFSATSLLLVRWQGLAGFARTFWMANPSPASPGRSGVSDMPSVQGMMYRLFENQLSGYNIRVIALALSLGLVLIAAIYLRNHLSEQLGFSAMLAATLLTSYNCHLCDSSLLLLPIFLTISYAGGRQMTPAKKRLRHTLACLFIAPVVSFSMGVTVVILFLATIALGAQQVLELRRGFAGVLLSRPAYAPRHLVVS